MIHPLPYLMLDEFKKITIDEPDNIVGFYLELHRDGRIRGSYTTDNTRPQYCDYNFIRAQANELSDKKPRIYHNIPIELYMEMYKNFMHKECSKMHGKWMQVPYDDIWQMFCEALVKCYNKGLYICNPRVILRSFYNNVYTHVRKNYNFLVNTDSLDEQISQDNENSTTILDTLEDINANPKAIEELEEEEREKVEKLELVLNTLKELGYGERTMANIIFEIDKKAQSRDTRRILDKVRERLKRLGIL